MSSDFSVASATRLLSFLDSAPLTPDGVQGVAVGLALGSTVTPTTMRHLALSIEDQESAVEAPIYSKQCDIE